MKIRTNADLSTRRFAIALALACLFGKPASQAQITFEQHLIDQNGPGDIWGKGVGDIDGDGMTDFIVSGRSGLVWYKSPQWTRWPIDSVGGFSTDVEASDIDRDGAVDVVVVHDSGLRCYRRDGGTGWVMHQIGTDGLHDVEVGDFDGDGDLDAVARNQGNFGHSGQTLYLYLQNSPTSWARSTISIPDGEGLKAADLDQDGDLDVVVTGNWYENTGGAFLAHSYTTTYTHASLFIDAADINGDGRLDIVVSPSELAGQRYRVSWFEAPVDPKGGTFSEHIIEADVQAVHHFVGVGDFDCDGDIDVASAEMAQGADPDEIKIYVNSNSDAPWTKNVIGTTGSHSMRVVDADLDGDLDLFGANWNDKVVGWWENTGSIQCESVSIPGPPSGPGSLCVEDSGTFSASGASSSRGHSVEYQFDWGDGSQSSWGSSPQSHSWSSSGTYCVKARARCATHTSIASDWSGCKNASADSPPTWYHDADDDQYGDPGDPLQQCSPPDHYLADNTDCDDTNALINPAATEVCDTVDNDCDGQPDEGVTTTYYRDADGDTYGDLSETTQACSLPAGHVTNSTDCNDANAGIHPNADEACNGVDDDCDGQTDENVKTIFYADSDSDGYGTMAASQEACTAPPGYVTDSSDCNDGNNAVYPGAAEMCNGVDDDCDTAVDEGVKTTFYQDADNDGYGNPAVSTEACTAPSGYVADYTDCNDYDPNSHPGATDMPNDHIDQDCDGSDPGGGDMAGSVQVVISPQEAIDAGAQWRVDGGVWRSSGATVTDLQPGDHTVSFQDVNGWIKPDSETVSVNSGSTITLSRDYQRATVLLTLNIAGPGGIPRATDGSGAPIPMEIGSPTSHQRGSHVTLWAEPAGQCDQFVRWIGTLGTEQYESTSQGIEIEMAADANLTAEFIDGEWRGRLCGAGFCQAIFGELLGLSFMSWGCRTRRRTRRM